MSQVTIYTKAYCPYCVRAKSVLDNKGVAYQEIRIDEQPELRPQMIERAAGRTTVPQILSAGSILVDAMTCWRLMRQVSSILYYNHKYHNRNYHGRTTSKRRCH